MTEGEPGDLDPKPIGRRLFLGLVGLGAAVTLAGGTVARFFRETLGASLGTDRFRIFTVTAELPAMSREAWRLTVDGGVPRPLVLDFDEVSDLGVVTARSDFHCVTGWSVHDVDWTGVKLATVLDAADAPPAGGFVRFHSFDGTYSESLTMEQARRPENMIAFELDGAPLSRDQGFPARVLVPAMYGYKGTKWLERIEITDEYVPGYWVRRGYDEAGWVDVSNG